MSIAVDEVLVAKKEAWEDKKQRLISEGKKLFAEHIPSEAKAVIVAERKIDETELMTDYFGSRTGDIIVLGWSKHTRDLFKEMRKHAGKFEKTKHLGLGKDVYSVSLIINHNKKDDGADLWIQNYGSMAGDMYYKGDSFHNHFWKDEIPGGVKFDTDSHETPVFETEEEAKDFVSKLPVLKGSDWSIHKESIEHREKYSMGAGYYLKDGFRHSDGWEVSKRRKWGEDWPDDIYLSLAQYNIFEGGK